MTFLNNLLGEGPLATIVAVALGLLVLVIVLAVIYRLSVGQGLRQAPGARSRQPRLGIVDAFDLDRQRQLVLVRRDNVEHLIMIGGPNDLLIEPAIIRGQPAQSAEPRREAGASGNGQNGDRVSPRLPSFEGVRDPDMEEPAARPPSFDAPPSREAPREFQPQMREPVREPMRDTSFAPPPVMAAPPPPPPVARPPMPSIPNGEGQGPGSSLRPMPPPVR
ncbi:MAG: flagellar biosynthesis protein FliO, partial [Hyphomicrobiales bacterium]|nr:flagellar biosynthesis protein FliO [Hyphomicrobiales bacterium]